MTRVSVIVCCYNDGPLLSRALESLVRQTMEIDQFEVVLVDDGSTDSTEEVANEFRSDLKLRYLRNQKNYGLVISCNRGLEAAGGDFVIRLDADDEFKPNILEAMVPPLSEDRTDLVYCDRYELVLDSGERYLIRIDPFDLFSLIAAGTMMRRELMLEVGGYRDVFWEEYDLYIRYLLRSGRAPARIPDPLYIYSRREGSMTSDRSAVERGWEELRALWSDEVLEHIGSASAQFPEKRSEIS